uniref:Uncharacterized protein n=1 Tax=Peronospora matthiolae TaxID=2874970 RepID=A0AAV1V9V6_9STRA
MRLSATLLLIVAPLHRCVDAVVLIPATTENPFLRSAPSAAADARNDGRSLRELNSAIGFGGGNVEVGIRGRRTFQGDNKRFRERRIKERRSGSSS